MDDPITQASDIMQAIDALFEFDCGYDLGRRHGRAAAAWRWFALGVVVGAMAALLVRAFTG